MVAKDATGIAKVVLNGSKSGGQLTMTTLEEPPQHLTSTTTSGIGGGGGGGGDNNNRHRSLHSIKCYPGGNNGLRTTATSSLSPHHNNGRSPQIVGNGYSNGGWTSQAPPKFGSADARASYNDKYTSNPSSSTSSSRFVHHHHHHHHNLRQAERSPHRTQSDRNGQHWMKSDGNAVISSSNSSRVGTGNGKRDVSPVAKTLYRSNSSLDLELDFLEDKAVGALRREYGSASSIDVMSTSGESFFAMLGGYGPTDKVDHRSPGSSKIVEYLRNKMEPLPVVVQNSNGCILDAMEETTSPKTKTKFQKLWDTKEKGKGKGNRGNGSTESSSSSFIFRKLRGKSGNDGASNSAETSSRGSDNSLDAEGRNEEKLRRKAFSHYDVQSVTANLLYASRLRNILGRRRNTTTGASAASMSNRNLAASSLNVGIAIGGSAEDVRLEETDLGDSRSNELVLSCPFFRNELGGEEERMVSLTRTFPGCGRKHHRNTDGSGSRTRSRVGSGGGNGGHFSLHRPNLACGLAVLEGASETHWKLRMCPYQRHSLQRENVDHGAHYYQQYFQAQEHQNWFGIDDTLGPIAVSIRREKVDSTGNNKEVSSSSSSSSTPYQYRLIIRTSELATLRGTVLEEAIPALRQVTGRGIRAKEVLDYVAPELQLSCLRLGLASAQTEEQLIKLDQQGLTNHYKVGILYCRAGQSTEEEMYNNEHPAPAFEEFLDVIGQRVRLKGFDKYRAQLDNKTDSTGLYSVYSTYQDCEVMFHVSTMLPYSPNNRQQLLRKRHIGNDIVTIVFQEPDALPFTPRNIRSQFQHVFLIVRAINPCSDNTRYSVAVSRSKEVPVFGPLIPDNATFPKSKAFTDFLLAKVINAENAAHRSDKFATMATRTRQEYLKDLANNHVSTTTIDTGPKFSILSFGGKKKEKPRPRFIPNACVRGAIVWQIQVDDYGQSSILECFLGISGDTVVLIDEVGRDVVFACPCTSILGWSSHTNSLRIYYHQGECIIIRTKDPEVDEIQEIVSRLNCVTQGCETQEFTLRRNSLGQLGFHVQQDGLITEVEQYGFAWQSGLRHNSRLVEICKVVVATLNYDQMVDLLKTSMLVTVTVIPPIEDGSPRRGCNLHNCGYLSALHSGGDYENLNGPDSDEGQHQLKASPSRQQQISHSSTKSVKYDSSGSPTRSTPSSGYSSRRSLAVNLENRYRTNEFTSASSQSSEEKWYDSGEITDMDVRGRSTCVGGSTQMESRASTTMTTKESPPPPLPARLVTQSYATSFNAITPRRRDPNHNSHHTHPSVGQNVHDQSGLHGTSNYAHLPPQSRNHNGRSANQTAARSMHLGSEGSGIDKLGNCGNYSRPLGSHPYISDQVLHDRLHQLRTSMANASIKSSNLVSSSSPIEKQLEALMERCHSSRSEDEQSGGSSTGDSLSPRSRRRQPLTPSGTSSGNSSKNQSPRTVGRSNVDMAEAQKRLGFSSFRNNVLGSSSESTFQEDLLKLINPDLIESEETSHEMEESGFKRPRTPPPIPSKTNSLDRVAVSREISNRSSTRSNTSRVVSSSGNEMIASPLSGDVIFTTARPATVISTASSSSSPAPSEPKLTKEERLSPRATTTTHPSTLTSKSLSSLPTAIMPLPDTSNDIDWPSLVSTATKAMESEITSSNGANVSNTISNLIPWIDNVTSRLGLDPMPNSNARRIRELEFRVRILEEELTKERHRKAALEMEVRRLRDENNRLQEESQTAANQLRRFTEWFFQAIDK